MLRSMQRLGGLDPGELGGVASDRSPVGNLSHSASYRTCSLRSCLRCFWEIKDDLRNTEGAKIRCGQQHFDALAEQVNPAPFVVARNLGDLLKAAD